MISRSFLSSNKIYPIGLRFSFDKKQLGGDVLGWGITSQLWGACPGFQDVTGRPLSNFLSEQSTKAPLKGWQKPVVVH